MIPIDTLVIIPGKERHIHKKNTTAFVLSSSNGPILFSEFWPIYLISFLWDKTQTALRHVSYVKLISDHIMKEEKLANIRHLKYKSKSWYFCPNKAQVQGTKSKTITDKRKRERVEDNDNFHNKVELMKGEM